MHEYNHPQNYLCFSWQNISTHKPLMFDRHLLHLNLVHFTLANCDAGCMRDKR